MENCKVVYMCARNVAVYPSKKIDNLISHLPGNTYLIPADAKIDGIE